MRNTCYDKGSNKSFATQICRFYLQELLKFCCNETYTTVKAKESKITAL